MAIDREILQIEAMDNNFNVNEYTIKYDSKTKRFFKGFAPQFVGRGAVIGTTVFAGLAVAALPAVGLLSLGVGTIAATSAAAGVLSSTAYSAGKYGINFSKSRFRNMGIGGKEGAEGSIEFIKQIEDEVVDFKMQLDEQPNTKTFNVNGNKMSRRALEKYIKAREEIAYYGLKYLLEQSALISDKINFLNAKREKYGLTENEEEQFEKYEGIMARISNCTQYMASQRKKGYNPYKGLIIESISKGCLIGLTDKQNNQIKLLSKSKDKNETAEKIYSNMYEKPLLKEIAKERKAEYEAISDVYNENQETINYQDIAIKYGIDAAKLKKLTNKQGKEIEEKYAYGILIGIADKVANSLPDSKEWKLYKNEINRITQEFKQAIEAKDRDQIEEKKEALDNIVSQVSILANNISYNKGKKAGAEELQTAFDDYKKVSEAELEKSKAKTKRTAVTLLKSNSARRKLEKEREDLENAYNSETEKNTKLQADLDKETARRERMTQSAWTNRQEKIRLRKANETKEQELQQTQIALDDSRADFESAMDGWMEAEQRDSRHKAEIKKHKEESAKRGKFIKKTLQQNANLANAYGASTKTIEELQQEVNASNYELENETTENNENKRKVAQREALIRRLAEEYKKVDANNDEQVKILMSTTRENMKLRRDLSDARSDLYDAEQESTTLYTGAMQTAEYLKSRDADVDRLQKAIASKDAKLKDALNQVDVRERQLHTSDDENKELKAKLTRGGRKVAIKMAKKQEEIRANARKAKEKDAVIARQKQANDRLMGSNVILGYKATRDSKKVEEQAEQLQQQADTIANIGYNLHTTSHELEKVSAERNALIKGVETFAGDNQALSRELDETKDRLDIVERQNKSQKETFESIIDQKDQEIARSSAENKIVRGKLEKERDKSGVLSIELEGAKKDLETQRRTIKSQAETIDQQATIISGQNEDIVNMGYDLHTTKTELKKERDLRNKLEFAVNELCGVLDIMKEELDKADETVSIHTEKRKIKEQDIARENAVKRLFDNYDRMETFLEFVEENCDYRYSDNIGYAKDVLNTMRNGGIANSDLDVIEDALKITNDWFNDNLKKNLPAVTIKQLEDFYKNRGYVVVR